MPEWKDWYEKHREDFNEIRREDYANNKERRAKAREAARDYRSRRKAGVVVERELTRKINGKEVRVYSSGEIADELECSRQMLVNWEKRSWLPLPLFGDVHRLYTSNQVKLIRYLWKQVQKAKLSGNRGLDSKLKDAVQHVYDKWSE